ncbi:MAG: V-type ATP synthase subunit I [Clostridiaceae bacterium]|nr:V-type ATP synthase subunit I [Clostridiaceae bacterium]
MAIVKMYKVLIIGMESQKAEVLEKLLDVGVLDISDLSGVALQEEWNRLVDGDGQEREVEILESDIGKVEYALEYLSLYDKRRKGLFEPKRIVEAGVCEEIARNKEKLLSAVEEINKFDEKFAQLKKEKNRLQNLIDALEPWKASGIPLDLASTKTTGIMFGVIPAVKNIEQVIGDIGKEVQECFIEIVSADRDQAYLQVVFHKSREEELVELLKQKNFNRVVFDLQGTAAENINLLKLKITEIEKKHQELTKEIFKYASMIEDLEALYDCLGILRDKKDVLKRLVKTDKAFMLEGWVPEPSLESFKSKMESVSRGDCIFYVREGKKEEEGYPILLENSRFVKPFELVTEMYSLPKAYEIDPNPLMAPFFAAFFGLMVSDAAYGLLMALGAMLVLYKFKPEGVFRKIASLLFWGGIFTFIWGALFGGWFGDAVEIITSGRFKIKPLWFNPSEDPMRLLIWSFVFGVIHLYVGMGIKGYNLAREGKAKDAILDVGSWYVFLTGLFMLLAGGLIAAIGKYMAIGGVILLVLTQGRHEKNIIKRLFKGVGSLYNTVGFVSDVLSYSRLLALGLATGVISSVVNTMGTMLGFSIPGIILLTVAFVIGHLFNLLINTIGAFVHASRLQYVEFFGKFYEGGGKPYKPFKINTKYINIVDGRKS